MHKRSIADQKRYQELRRMLEDRQREIHTKLRSIREAMPAEADVRDSEEQSVDDFVQAMDFALMQMKSDTLRRIDEALHHLEDGSYGMCNECGDEIAAARLRALPFADLCRDCQESRELRASAARDARSSRPGDSPQSRLGRIPPAGIR